MHGKREIEDTERGKITRMGIWALRGNVALCPGSMLAVEKHVHPCSGRPVGVVSDASESVFSPKCMLLVIGRAFMRLLKSRAISPGLSVLEEHYELKRDLHQVGPSSCIKA